LGTAGVVLHTAEERCGQRRDEYRASQCGSDGRAEVGQCVLDSADFAALLIRHRRHGHAAELRGQRADAKPRQQHRPGHDLGPGAAVERGRQDNDACEQREEPELDNAAGRGVREDLGLNASHSSPLTAVDYLAAACRGHHPSEVTVAVDAGKWDHSSGVILVADALPRITGDASGGWTEILDGDQLCLPTVTT
jgi:hypothetical protein